MKIWKMDKLTRINQYEVLRLYPSITFIPRMNAESPVRIPFRSPLRGKTSTKNELLVSNDCYISVNVYNLNFDKTIWGSDADVFRPGRFVDPIGSTRDGWTTQGTSEFFNEQLVAPPLGSFTPWNAGARICPGMKFAQVWSPKLSKPTATLTFSRSSSFPCCIPCSHKLA